MADLVRKAIWDLPTRLFHWTLVILIVAQYVTQKYGWMQAHFVLGAVVIGLLVFRLVWGVVGSKSARFSDFITGPGPVLAYLRHLIKGTPDAPHMGHNPLGAVSVILLLTFVAVQAVTGLFTTDSSFSGYDGPMAYLVSSRFESLSSSIHGSLFYWGLLIIAAHVGAVLFYRFVKHDNLMMPMITGTRMVPPDIAGVRFVSLWRAGVVAVVVGAATYGVMAYWGRW